LSENRVARTLSKSSDSTGTVSASTFPDAAAQHCSVELVLITPCSNWIEDNSGAALRR
jgi:hypothetical protein